MPAKKRTRLKKLSDGAAAIRPISARLSRMEDLLIEIRAEQDALLKKARALQARIDALSEMPRERPRRPR